MIHEIVKSLFSLKIGAKQVTRNWFVGTAQGGEVDDWYGDSGDDSKHFGYEISKVLDSKTSIAINGYLTDKQLENYGKFGNFL